MAEHKPDVSTDAPLNKKDLLGSRIWNEKRPPYIRVVWNSDFTAVRVPVRRLDAGFDGRPFFWAYYPPDARETAVTVFESKDSTVPIRSFLPLLGKKSSEHDVLDTAGETVMTLRANAVQSVFLTSWKATGSDGALIVTIRERVRDALWRRTAGAFTKLFRWDLDVLSFVEWPFAIVKPRCRMQVLDPSRKKIATLSHIAVVSRPGEDFSLYLNDGVTDDDLSIFTAAFAVMQKMR